MLSAICREQNMKQPIIEMIDVTAFYGSIVALKHVTLSVYEKEFLGVFGPNGGGKSSLLKLLLGLGPKTTGSIKVFSGSPLQARKKVGYVPQHSQVNRSFPATVFDLVLMGQLPSSLQAFFSYGKDNRKKALENLAILGLEGLEHRLLQELSGGQLQRALLARTLMSEPALILLDEPTASVDTKTRQTIYQVLKNLHKKGTTILIVSHDIATLAPYVSHVACLNQTLHYHGQWPTSGKDVAEAFGCSVEMALSAFGQGTHKGGEPPA